jgi:hypothetical protein
MVIVKRKKMELAKTGKEPTGIPANNNNKESAGDDGLSR